MTPTGHKAFDKQCRGGLITGNVIGDAQFSWYIRPRHATECNGFTFAPGELLATDLKTFQDLPPTISKFIDGLNRQEILNEIRHWTGPTSKRKKHVHGYIVTEGHELNYAHVRTFYTRGAVWSLRIMAAVTPALTGQQS